MTKIEKFIYEFSICCLFWLTVTIPIFALKLNGYPGRVTYYTWLDIIEAFTCMILVAFFMPFRIRKIFFFILFLFCGCINFLSYECFSLFHRVFYYEYASSLFLTDIQEAKEFLQTFGSLQLLFALFICFGPLFLLNFLPTHFRFNLKKYWWLFIISLSFLLFYGNILYERHYVIYDMVYAYKGLRSYEDKLKEYNPPQVSDVQDLDNKSTDKTYIVILSDAVSRSYLSLYDYIYNSTPFMKQKKSELLVFDDVTAYYDLTLPTMEKILTFSENEQDKDKIFSYPNLLDFYKSAGFKVYWLSSGTRDGLIDQYSYLTSRANIALYHQASDAVWTDELLLPKLEKALQDESHKKVIFLHLRGSHIKYTLRYPEGFADQNSEIKKIESIKGVDERFVQYIKTLLFGDSFWNKIIAIAKQQEKSSVFVLYLSDHGEDVDMFGNAIFMHGGTDKKKVFEIPFVLWLSDTYKKNNKKFVEELSKNLHRPYEISTLNHSLLDLSRLDTSFLDKTKSIFNRAYKERPRRYDTLTK